jgi:hypothetical protein
MVGEGALGKARRIAWKRAKSDKKSKKKVIYWGKATK